MDAYLNGRDALPWATQCAQLPHNNTEAKYITFLCERFIPDKLRGHPFWGASRGVISHRTINHHSR